MLRTKHEAWHQFLERLDADLQQAKEKYEEMRERLIFYFERNGCQSPSEQADQTFDLVITEIAGENEIGNLTRHCFRVAQRVLQEHWFDRFVELLGEAGEKYETLHQRLMDFFARGGCPTPAEQLDETIKRVIKRMSGAKKIADPAGYCDHVARAVLHEYWLSHNEPEMYTVFWEFLGQLAFVGGNFETRLDSDPERVGENHLRIWEDLLAFFDGEDDLANEAIKRLARNIAEGRKIDNFRAFYRGIARNVRLEHWRKLKRVGEIDETVLADTRPWEPKGETEEETLEQAAQQGERQINCLRQCLKSLPREDRKLRQQYSRAGKFGREYMATRRGISRGALRLRIFHINEKLRKCLVDCLKQSQ
jgi:DNA-directed RNA polymerase specialized sigma24 family protein